MQWQTVVIMLNKQLYDIRVQLHRETDKAVLVSETGDKEQAVWLPRSQIECVEVDGKPGLLDVTMPEWLAQEKGLI
jgi:hypothetical protein